MTDKKIITAHHVAREIACDDFEHPEWDKAAPVQINRRWSGDAAPNSQQAEARILWTPESLVVRFVGPQSDEPIVSPQPQLRKKTIGLWDRDVCEIFIAPDESSPHRYFEFEASPNGEWIDLGIEITPEGRLTDWDYQSGMHTASRIVDEELTTIIRVPWSESITKPNVGDRWRLNLFRCVGTGNERYLAWQPTHTEEPNFHVPEKFGWLLFV